MALITETKYVMTVCKPSTVECCRYLTASAAGFECAKHTALKALLDERVALKTIRARGDNCPGIR